MLTCCLQDLSSLSNSISLFSGTAVVKSVPTREGGGGLSRESTCRVHPGTETGGHRRRIQYLQRGRVAWSGRNYRRGSWLLRSK